MAEDYAETRSLREQARIRLHDGWQACMIVYLRRRDGQPVRVQGDLEDVEASFDCPGGFGPDFAAAVLRTLLGELGVGERDPVVVRPSQQQLRKFGLA